MKRAHILQALKVTSPVFFGYIAIGIPFGLMLVDAGYPWWMAPLMSLIMYAGAGQYVAVGLFAAGAPLGVMMATTLMVNIRHTVYGLSLIDRFKGTGGWKVYLVFALTDETYALLSSIHLPDDARSGPWYALVAGLNQFYWVCGGLVGALAGLVIPLDFEGVDFALTALFTVLLIDQIKASRNIWPPVIGGLISILLLFAGEQEHMLIIALTLGIGTLLLLRSPVEAFEQRRVL